MANIKVGTGQHTYQLFNYRFIGILLLLVIGLFISHTCFADIIVESGSGGLNHNYYSEVGIKWLDSTSKSTAAGLTSGISARFCDLQSDSSARDTARFTPLINTAGNYEVFVTWNLGNSSTVRYQVFYPSGNTIKYLLQDGYGQQSTSNANTWISLGTYTFSSGTTGRVEMTSATASGVPGTSGNYRVYADAVKWVWASAPITPVAQFNASPTTGQSPLTVNFTDNSLNNPTTWQWNFGDGNSSKQQNPTHVYSVTTDSYFTVIFTTANSAGSDSLTRINYIHVNPPPIPPAPLVVAIDSVSHSGIIVTNNDLGFSTQGIWAQVSLTGQWGNRIFEANALLSSQSNATARWQPSLPKQQKYNIYVWYPTINSQVNDAHYKVYYSGGSQDFYVNQTVNYAGWYYLGSYNFDSGSNGFIQLTNDTRTASGSYSVVADAVLFEPIQQIIVDDGVDFGNAFKTTGTWSITNTPTYFYGTSARFISAVTTGLGTGTAIWRPFIPANGIYKVDLCYPSIISGYSLATDANFTVVHKTGKEKIIVPEYAHGKINGGHWYSLGTFAFDSGTTGYVMLTNLAPLSNGKVVAADAVRFTTFSPLPALEGGEFRSFWAHGLGVIGLRNITEVTALIETARRYNFNAVVVHTRVAGDAYYDSAYEPKCSALGSNTTFDTLSALVALAHDTTGGKPYIEVHAWLNPYRDYSSSVLPNDTTIHLRYTHPEWFDQTNSGATSDSGMQFTNPAIPDNQDYHYKVWLDCIRNYQLDGIHTDDYFYQGSTWGFNAIATSRFAAEYGYAPTASDANHNNWRRQEVTNFVKKIYAECLTINPNFKWSIAPVASGAMTPYTSSGAYASGFSDWIDWYSKHYIDVFIPEIYTGYNSIFMNNILFSNSTAKYWGRHMYFGVGNFSLAMQTSFNEIQYSRTTGNTPGMVLFDYNSAANDTSNTAFYQNLSTQLYMIPTTTAAMPWKSNPIGGFLKGIVSSSSTSPYPYFNGKAVYKSLILYSGPNGNGSTYSDGNGYFILMDVPYGKYTVTAYYPPSNTAVAYQATGIQIMRGIVTPVDWNSTDTTLIPPIADFNGSPRTGIAPLNVQFYDQSSGGSPTNWFWNFGDSSTISGIKNPTHSYQSTGYYSVTLIASNTYGYSSAVKVNYIQVLPPPLPQADFYATPTSGTAPLDVQFYDISTGNPTAWAWNFGDGSTDTTQNPQHTYNLSGNYSIQLIASNGYGASSTQKAGYISVAAPSVVTLNPTYIQAFPSYGGVKLYWQNPNRSDYSGTLIVYRTDRYPLTPEDGTIAYWYNGTQCNIAGTNGQKYYFTFFCHDTAMNFSTGAFVAAIPNSYANVRDFSITEPWVGAAECLWINPTETGQHDSEILIRRKDRLPVDPADGYDPDSGRWFQYWYNTQSYGEPGLTVGSTYYYGIYAVDTMMNFAGGLAGAFVPGYSGINNVSSIRFTPGYGTISVSWINPTNTTYLSTLVVRRNDRYPTSPTDGTVAYWYNIPGFLNTGLNDGQKYYYGIFAMDTNNHFSPGMFGAEYTSTYGNISHLVETPGNGSITLTWQNPNRTDFQKTLIVRRTDRMPLNAFDGQQVYENTGTSFTDTSLTPGQTYYYGFFAHDAYFNCSEGIGISNQPK